MYSLHLVVCFSKTRNYCSSDYRILRAAEVRYLKGQFWVFYMWLGWDNPHNKLEGRKFRLSCIYLAAADRENVGERQTGCPHVQSWQRRGLWTWPETRFIWECVHNNYCKFSQTWSQIFQQFSKVKLLLEIKEQVVQCQVLLQRIWKQHLYSGCQCCFLKIPVTSQQILFKWKWACKAKGSVSAFNAHLLTL